MSSNNINMNTYDLIEDTWLLDKVRNAGFKPIGMTVMICEETFIFKTKKEAESAWEIFKPEGWWYDIGTFIDARKKYVDEAYKGREEDAPIIYWFDKNYEPKS